MAFVVGNVLNHYTITGTLGEGGMGTVYAADDAHLGRPVAIKVLPSDFASDPERLQRFEREARAVASLNHPNVVTLYSVEEADETRFLTMELVDGESVSAMIGSDGVSLEEFFRLTLPLVEALGSAHGRGITHRDLKPSNIMVDREGRVKLLDFGLAKLTEGQPLVPDSDSQAPTDLATGTGKIVGTVAYMSPEQAEGRLVDGRSDIFSLGVVFYEMITGRAPFVGDSPVSVLSSILRVEPEPVAAVRRGVPRQLQRILDTCLAKDPRRRYQTVIDLRNALDALRDELRAEQLGSGERRLEALPAAATLGEPPSDGADTDGSGKLPALARAAALLAVGAVLGAAIISQIDSQAVVEEATADIVGVPALRPLVTSLGRMPAGPVFSPTEHVIVYSGDYGGQRDLYRLVVTGGEPDRITDSPESETDPDFHPGGSEIAYTVQDGDSPGIYVRPTDGRGRRIIENASKPAFSPDGEMIAFVKEGAIWVAAGNDYVDQDRKTNHLGGPLDPTWSPDGESLFVWSEAELDIMRVPLDPTQPAEKLELVPTGEQVGSLQVSGDHTTLVMTRGQYGGYMSVWAVPLDPNSGDVVGPSEQLTTPLLDDRDAAVSFDGKTVAFLARKIERHLSALPLDASTGLARNGEQQLLTRRELLNYYPGVSRDGKTLGWTAHGFSGFVYTVDLSEFVFGEPFLAREEKVTIHWDPEMRETAVDFLADGQLVFSSTEAGTYQLRKSECPRCSTIPLTDPGADAADFSPNVSPDGSQIVFTSLREGSEDLWLVAAEGGDPRRLTSLPGAEQSPVWTPNGESIIFLSLGERGADLWIVDLYTDDPAPRPYIREPGEQNCPAWSVDGKRLYFTSNRSGAWEVWMQDENAEIVQITFLAGSRGGLPTIDFFTKFAVTEDMLIVPVEAILSDELWVLELPS